MMMMMIHLLCTVMVRGVDIVSSQSFLSYLYLLHKISRICVFVHCCISCIDVELYGGFVRTS